MEKADQIKYNSFDSSSDTSSVGSDESLEQVVGPNFADFARQLEYEKVPGNYFFPYEKSDDKKTEGTYIFPSTITQKVDPPKSTDITTLFLIDSMNRDRAAFPQPTNLTLRLPRVYKNVKSIQLTQVKLLCSFYYFSVAKSNIYLPIIEKGRGDIINLNGSPVTKVITIRQGTYGIGDLLSEIQTEMNYTPLFYDFPDGFTDFIKIFTASGDYSINFNQPGDSYYDSLNNKYIQNPTLATIVSYYWGSRYAGLLNYSMDQLKVAYYYPVFYEVFLDKKDLSARASLILTGADSLLGPGETVYSHIIFNMSGINDNVALFLINQNITILDQYRLNHTFRYSLVNRYQVAYDTNSLQVNFTTVTLNTSLVNLINNTGSSALTSILTNLGLTPTTYAALQLTVNKATVVYTSMYQFLQKQLTTLAGIPFAKYAPEFFNDVNNVIYFQNGLNAIGVRKGYDLSYLTSGEVPLVSTPTYLKSSPGYWPNLISSMGYNGTGLTTINPPNSLIPYNISAKNFQFGTLAIDSSNYFFNTNKSLRSVDVVANILPAQYTIFKFRSSARQTLQVETLPLPYYYRYSDYNKDGLYTGVLDLNRENVPQKYFDLSYNFVYGPSNSNMDVLNYSPIILNPVFGQPFDDSLILAETLDANTQKSYYNFEFIAPYPPDISSGLCVNNTSMSFVSILSESISTLFPDSFTAYVYHDRGAFMADLGNPRSENALHYIQSASVDSTSSDLTIQFSTFSGHTYYTIFRSDNLACSNTLYKPTVYYNDSEYVQIQTDYTTLDPLSDPNSPSNIQSYPFVTNYNPDFTRLPFNSSLIALDPTTSSFNVVLTLQGNPIGYDTLGVSNDLTDYVGYISGQGGVIPNTQFRIDPLTYHTFQSVSPFDTIAGTYFNSKSSNSILQPITNNIYKQASTLTQQLKIVHWYDGYSIPRQSDDQFTTFKTIRIAQTSSISNVISQYPMNSAGIVLGRGINAIGFLPNDGLFNVSSFAFKSCIYPISGSSVTSEDPNLQIAYVGVFSGLSLVNNVITLSSAITVLKFNRAVPYGPGTLARTPGFGVDLGTWYEYLIDPNFVKTTSDEISGYTPNSTELISYNSMYYMVPFSSEGVNLTYSALSGSLLAYPLSQNISTSSNFYEQTAQNSPGALSQPVYITPIPKIGAPKAYGPQGIYSQSQSQYEQSIPITTTSIGYKEYSYLANDVNAPFSFSTIFTNSISTISSMVTTAFFSEYSDRLYIANTSSVKFSNALTSYPSAFYASSLSTVLSENGVSSTDCINYLVNPPSTLQNYPIQGVISNYSTFTFNSQLGNDINFTTASIELNSSMSNITMWLWGAGGGTWSNTSSISGGAGAYVKVNINVGALRNLQTQDATQGISTLYLVVGKGGNRGNVHITETIGSLQLYEQARYGGGGTSLLGNFIDGNSISLQGGGFSGLFSGPNLLEATPLLIVGGGGAAGSVELGGPGGFGITPPLLSINNYPFSSATFQGLFYNPLPVIGVQDIFNNPVLNNSTIQNVIDSSLPAPWSPTIPSKMNPQNYIPTPNTYGLSLQFSNQLTSLSKLRYYGPPQSNLVNLPTGFILYNDINKSQILYSNTSIQPSDFQVINNGTFLQQIYDIIPTVQIQRTTIRSNAWIIVGTSGTSQTSIQYSLDGISWVPTNSMYSNITSVQYISAFSKWYATSSTILESSDGMNWSPCLVNGFTGTRFNSLIYNSTFIAAGDGGKFFISTDGYIWNPVPGITGTVNRLRFINGFFWAIGVASVRKSTDGQTWSSVTVSASGMNDIAYGVGRYVIAQTNTSPPFYSGLIYSSDGVAWTPVSQVNVGGFSATSVVYANNLFVSVGNTADGSSFIKYSQDGINWSNSNFPIKGDLQRNDIQYIGNKFVSVGTSIQGTGLAGNQVSVITSTDGKSWSYSLSGGFDPDTGSSSGRSSGYGPVAILPNLNTMYIEIQKTSNLLNELQVYELRTYDTVSPIPANTSNLIDNNATTLFYPPQQNTIDVIQYPFILNFPSVVSTLNTIQIYSPSIPDVQFTGVTLGISPSSIIYSDSNAISSNLNQTTSFYEINLIPALKNVSTLSLTLTKITPGSLQVANINASYNPNKQSVQQSILTIVDLDNRPLFRSVYPLTNIKDGSLTTYWKPGVFIPGDSLKLDFTFTGIVDRINYIQIYSGSVLSESITGIGVYTDSSKSLKLYSNNNLIFTDYLGIYMAEFDIIPLLGYTKVYIEIYKVSQGLPTINEIKFFNIGIIQDTPSGFSGGNIITMARSSNSLNVYNGGGGSSNVGGNGGPLANVGTYLIGGSPAILENQAKLSNTSQITGGIGGGGGGFYGGGGGGVLSSSTGGSGGGGSGFIRDTSIFTILDYGVAKPGLNTTIENYISPGLSEQTVLINSDAIEATSVSYGQGGSPSIDSGKGGHGLIVMKYELNSRVEPPTDIQTVLPSFIDGSQLSVYESPITYDTKERVLSFSTFRDPIEFTEYAGYNWVWYRSYLSLVGLTLTRTMKASSLVTTQPVQWPSLPLPIFTSLSLQFSNIVNYFTVGTVEASEITDAIEMIFITFQDLFIQVSHTNSSYYEMTEIYCLLDYLRSIDNLENPHVNPDSSSLDRILGGIPRFGYWANPFFTNVSYIGFDVSDSQIPIPALSTLSRSSSSVRAIYGLVLEQSLITGLYGFKDIMAYKPVEEDGLNWLTVTQFNESYAIRSLTNSTFLGSNIPVQPYTFKNAILGRLPLFNYSVYTAPTYINSNLVNVPVQILNDFEGKSIYMYSFQNTVLENISSINISQLPFTSTTLKMNQQNITQQAITSVNIMGTLVSEYTSTVVNSVTSFGFNGINYIPILNYSNQYYNTFSSNSNISSVNVGKAINDVYGNYYFTGKYGSDLFQNVDTLIITPKAFVTTNINYASPKYILSQYNSNVSPYYDFFNSKFTNIWHVPGNTHYPLKQIYGVRLNSPYDFSVLTNFANQIFYPTHKITLIKTGSLVNPIKNTTDIQPYPSFQHTQMFFYKNYTSMVNDISGQFAMESTSNFSYSDMFSGYNFNSYIYNINLPVSTDFNNDNADSFNYLAIRGYSPSETFQSLVRFYLPQRYDFGYISLKDLSNEQQIIQNTSNVNPDYKAFLSLFNGTFSTNQVYGATGLPGFSGSNISTVNFGDFLLKYNAINTTNMVNSAILSTIVGLSNLATLNLITGDLQHILPPYLANRNRITDPVEFSIPFSSCVTPSNALIEQYGMGYNLGFALADTEFNTVHRATSFFKLLDDAIFLRMNEEYGMNKMDMSQPENFAQTLDTTAQSGLYNSKLILNSFGSFATTFVQSPVTFNPVVGKLDKLSFSWYDSRGVLLDNNDCEWSGSVQIVESVTASA